jgi:hypothetical protein
MVWNFNFIESNFSKKLFVDNWVKDKYDSIFICGNSSLSIKCPNNSVCLLVGENPNHGYTSFDNYLYAMLSSFRLISQDYWEDLYYRVIN